MNQIRETCVLPDAPDSNCVYRLLPKNPSASYYAERVDRNIGWITEKEQSMLRNATIGVAGCGGMGAQLAEKFLRLGVGEIRIADNEVFDASNINRQFAATRKTIGKSKAFETAKILREVTDDNTVVVYPQGICEATVDAFISGCDVICDEIEFWAIAARILLHQCARNAEVPVFNCNTIGFGTRLFLFTPESQTVEEAIGFTFEEACELEETIRSGTASEDDKKRLMEQLLVGLIPELPDYCPEDGFRKRLLEEGKASIIATNPPLATGFLADRVLLYLLRNSELRPGITETPVTPSYLYFDAAMMVAKTVLREKP